MYLTAHDNNLHLSLNLKDLVDVFSDECCQIVSTSLSILQLVQKLGLKQMAVNAGGAFVHVPCSCYCPLMQTN